METKNVSNLKIHKLSKAQYERELAAGNIDEYALYLTPDEEIDLSPYATKEELNAKADSDHNHDSAYDAKGAASTALSEAKTYADSAATTAANTVKNDLLNGAGAAYDTLKELGDLIDTNTDAIDALESVAAGKADASHTHAISDVTGLQSALDGKAASSHGTHVSYSTTAPVMDGTASAGSASTVARSDHTHPTDTSRAAKTDLDSHTANTTLHITSTERTNWNAAKTHADSAHAPSNAEKNQNAFSNVVVGSTTIAADSATDTLTLVAGSNVTLTPDASNDKVTIAAQDTVYTHPSYTARTGVPTANQTPVFGGTFTVSQPVSDSTGHVTAVNSRTVTIPSTAASTSAAGLMSASDKTKLDGIASGANAYSLPTASSTTLGGVKTGSNITNSSGTISLTKANVTSALGYTPPTTDTTYTSLKNPYAVTIQANGTSLGTYDGSAAKNFNITPSGIGVYTKAEIDAYSFITTDDIDTICGQSIVNAAEVTF